MDQFAQPKIIGLCLAMALLGGLVFLGSLLATQFHIWGFSQQDLDALDKLPRPVVALFFGLALFAVFFPFFMALYFVRGILAELTRLEGLIENHKASE
jgi:hypothetical protein